MSEPSPDSGALRAITPASVLAALGCIRTGKVYDLGVDLGPDTPRLPPEVLVGFRMEPYLDPARLRALPELQGNSFSNETITGGLHQSTHLDALIHAQRHGRVYGGGTIEEWLTPRGWRRYGVETVPPIVTRAVLLDVAAARGEERVPDGVAIGPEALAAALDRAKVALRPGDTVLVRTGKIRQYTTDRPGFEAGCPGLSGEGARWLADRGMICFALDTTSADPSPVPDWNDTAHEVLLIQRGIPIVENVFLEELARDGVHECLFICLPLRIQGATGSWVRPIAIV